MGNKEVSINLIYWGLQHLIWVIDKLDYDYMVDWRNQMSDWQIEIEKKCNWVGKNQRSYGTCPCDCSETTNKTKEKINGE